MKLLAALLVFMIAAQPVQAGFCDTEPSGSSNAHAGMQHGGAPEHGAHDCCQSPGADSESDGGADCSDMRCGSCVAGAQAIPPAAALPTPAPSMPLERLGTDGICPSHASPPFRPPIHIS